MNDLDPRPGNLAWIAAFLGILLSVSSLTLMQVSGCRTLSAGVTAAVVVALVSLASGGRLRFGRRQAEEEEAARHHREEHGSTELFQGSDDAVRIAARASRSYLRYFVPTFTALLGIAVVLVALLRWRSLGDLIPSTGGTKPSLQYSVLVVGLLLGCLTAGSYYVGISREPGCRWLRPTGAWLFCTGALFLPAILVLIGQHFKIQVERLDLRMTKLVLLPLFLLGAELIINFIIEFYRPRGPEAGERPLYESRLLSLFTEPGGVAQNVAASLDYQFGFEVSEVWFYRFLERAVIPFAAVMAVGFWLLSCVVVINAEETGILERFGRVVYQRPLGPGLYLKLPWPFSRLRTFPVERVQEIPVGYIPATAGSETEPEQDPENPETAGDPTGRIMLWSKQHTKKELDFVVASAPDMAEPAHPGARSALPVTVYLMSASIPLYFRVSNLYDYEYRHRAPRQTLEELATREVVRYLANVDFFRLLTSGRAEGAEELRRRIQTAADEVHLGIEVVFVGLQGVHPPVTVGRFYDEVVAAMEERHAAVLEAERYAVQTELLAEAEALRRVSEAQAYREDRIRVPKAEAERFGEQLVGYRAAPELFRLRSLLDVLERDGSQARKYVVVNDESRQVVVLDLQEKLRPDLLDLDLQNPDETK